MDQQTKFQRIMNGINTEVPAHTMWDGFWIDHFRRGTLIVCASHDRIYGSDFNFVFKKVIFFNLPESWRDTSVVGDDAFRLSNALEFRQHHPDFDPQNKMIFAVDMEIMVPIFSFENGVAQPNPELTIVARTFFIVAAHIYLEAYNFTDNRYYSKDDYEDTLAGTHEYPCMKNRVLPKKK